MVEYKDTKNKMNTLQSNMLCEANSYLNSAKVNLQEAMKKERTMKCNDVFTKTKLRVLCLRCFCEFHLTQFLATR